jgi:hypothetical protein
MCTACPMYSGTNGIHGAATVAACVCNPGYLNGATVDKSCMPCAAASPQARVQSSQCQTDPPTVSLRNLPNPKKVNPSAVLVFEANVSTTTGSKLQLIWDMWQPGAASTLLPVELSAGNLLSSRHDQNLVLQPNVLTSGTSYVVRLTATEGDVFGQGYLEFETNDLPWNGSLVVEPTQGTALTTRFKMLADGWIDADVPLRYEFSLCSQVTGRTLLRVTADKIIDVALPPTAGPSADEIELSVIDVYDAAATSTSDVLVRPYVPPNGWLSAIVDMAGTSDGTPQSGAAAEASVQLLGTFSMSLNFAVSQNSTGRNSSQDAAMSAARLQLVSALGNVLETAPASSALLTQISDCLQAVTQVPEQLTAEAVESTLDVLVAIVSAAKGSGTAGTPTVSPTTTPKLSVDAGYSMGDVISNLFTARSAIKDGTGVRRALATSTTANSSSEAEYRKQASLVETLVSTLESACQAIGDKLVPGQNAAQLRTATFSAAVESVDIDTMAAGGQVLSSRSVRLPPGISGDGAASQHRVLCATS